MTDQSNLMSEEPASRPDRGRERRVTQRALKAWTEAHYDDSLPTLANLTGSAEMADEYEVFTDNQFLIMYEASSTDLVVIFYGDDLPNMLVRRNLGNSLKHSLPPAMKNIFHDACMEAIDHGDTVYRHGMISTPSGDGVLYRSIFMPLRTETDPNRVYVFGAFSNEAGAAGRLAA